MVEERRALGAELLGTAVLLLAVVGSGIVVADEPTLGAALFPHAVVVGVTLVALILTFGPVSGAHLNPAVTIVDAVFGGLPPRRAARYVVAQLTGAVLGTILANLMFSAPVLAVATTARPGAPLVLSEAIATGGLLVVIFGVVRSRNAAAVPYAVGAYITGAIVFTSSASFANPAVTIARTLTDTWTGIAPVDAPGFVLGQVVGAAAAVATIRWLFHPSAEEAAQVVVEHDELPDRRQVG